MDYSHIVEMTKIYEDHIELLKKMDEVLYEFKEHQREFKKLEEYYYSDQFRNDFDASNNFEIPDDINQGILTEDAIYDVLGDNYYMAKELLNLANDIIQD